jgi:hypothetical protein
VVIITRLIEGFVCLGMIEEARTLSLLYGPPISPDRKYESLESNGLAVWPNRRAAVQAQGEIRRLPIIRRVSIQRLMMRVAETEDDLVALHRSHSLVVIMPGDPQDQLYRHVRQLFGPMRPGCVRVCDGLTSLAENGLRTFTEFEEAEHYAREMSRQCLTRVMLATFATRRS